MCKYTILVHKELELVPANIYPACERYLFFLCLIFMFDFHFSTYPYFHSGESLTLQTNRSAVAAISPRGHHSPFPLQLRNRGQRRGMVVTPHAADRLRIGHQPLQQEASGHERAGGEQDGPHRLPKHSGHPPLRLEAAQAFREGGEQHGIEEEFRE